MFGKRSDGRRIHDVGSHLSITPYIMKSRNDAMNFFSEVIPTNYLDAYIEKRKADGLNLNYLHLLMACAIRVIAQNPGLNRFVANKRLYARDKIWVCFDVHQSLRSEAAGTTIKLAFEGTETIDKIYQIVNSNVIKETSQKEESNGVDELSDKIMRLPSPIISFGVNLLMWLDKHGILPKSILNVSPFHTTLYITYLKSLGINSIFHHVYNFGTTGIFLAIGKERLMPIVGKNSEVVATKAMNIGVTTDERYCDGLYFARCLKQFARLIRHLEELETPLDHRIEDVK